MSKTTKPAQKPETQVIREATIKRNLRWNFTQSEILEISRRLAEKTAAKATLEEEKKRATKDYGARIATEQNIITDLSRKVTNGYEFRDMDCRVIFDKPKVGQKTVTRLDNSELVGIEDMSHEEKQMVIPSIEAEVAKNGGESAAKNPASPPTKKRRASKPGVVTIPADEQRE